MIERNNQLKVDKKQVALLGIAGLRDTPNRGNTWGQNGLTAEDLKKRFDALPLHVADKLNGLIDALGLGAVVVLDKKGNAYTLAEIASMAQTGGGGGGNGATFIPDVSEDGILSWTNDKDLPNPVPAKVTGKDGKTAYDYAKDGGYKGSEADFAARLAEDIPRSLSDLENDTGFIDAEGAPVQSVNGKTGAVSLLYEDVGADPSGTAYTEVSTHNTSDDAHSDIRLLLSALASRVNTALNSSDVDLDQLSEIVAYIKNNSSLIAGVTTSKVNVSDIIDNLTTNMASKPLSAAQGVALKALVDGKISLSGLQGAISSALAEAKASGEFDGEDGVGIAKIEQTGSAGASIDIYTITLTNGTSYTFSVTNGTKGDPGKDGTSPTVAVIKSGKVTTITITDKNGTKTATVNDGADGSSVSVSSVSESTADGGSNVVTFSDGKKVTVKNGKDGEDYVLTAADKQEIKNAIISSIITQEAGQSESLVMSQKAVTDLVEDALGSGGSTQYETVDSVDKMTDTSKQYVLSTTGTIWEHGAFEVEPQNKLIRENITLNARYSGTTFYTGKNGYYTSDFIEVDMSLADPLIMRVSPSGVLRINGETKIMLFDANKNVLQTTYVFDPTVASSGFTHDLKTDGSDWIVELGYVRQSPGPSAKIENYDKIKFIRINALVSSSASITLADVPEYTVRFDAERGTEYKWYDTGLQPSTSGGGGNYVTLLTKVNKNASDIKEVSERVTALETGSETLTIPSFWQDALDVCISKIKALQVGRNCVTFPFFSDNHTRNGYAGMLIAHVMKECNIPYAFYGGDSIDSGYIESEAVMIAQDKAFDTAMTYIPNGRFCRAIGNHDGYWAVDANERHEYTDAQNYELFLREESVAQNKHFGGDGTYYYVDDIASKVRWIVLDTNDGTVESEQISWVQNTALSFTESGWAVVFISHQPISNHYHANISNAAEVRTVVKNYINGSAENKAAVVGWYSGHIHRDRIYTGAAVNTSNDSQGDAMGFTQVTITSDHTGIAYDDATKHTVANDDQSHAIDFVTINKATRQVNLTRLGIGSDRSYTY